MASRDAALRKRQQIAKANRMMFIWVAAASALVGFAVVISVFLVQKLIFNEGVIAEKNAAVNILKKNNEVAETLKENVRVLNTNEDLIGLKATEDSEPVQVVLDALPSIANSAALGASLQGDKLLGQSGVTIESLTVDPVSGEQSNPVDSSSASEDASQNAIHFTFSVSSAATNATSLKKVLVSLERSIRALNITSLNFEQQGTKLVMTGEGEGYYSPAQTLDLKTETRKQGGKKS